MQARPDATATGALEVRTRGLRKFGRPDAALRGVPPAEREGATRFARHLADRLIRGASIAAGEAVAGPGGRRRLVGTRVGGRDDPEYDNAHLEFRWA